MKNLQKLKKQNYVDKIIVLNNKVKRYKKFLVKITFNFKNLSLKKTYIGYILF
jgi:hypothetical protein